MNITDIEMNENDSVIVKNMKYVNNVSEVLNKLELESWEWANYLGFKLLRNLQVAQKTATTEFEDNCMDYLISGNKVWRYGLLHGAVGSMYVRKYFDDEN